MTWTNKDFGIHTVTENQGLFGSKELRPDQTFGFTFEDTELMDITTNFIPKWSEKLL
ncbi:hypothetical protein [Candidatus Nitrosocosmicus hydrocola]|uniref:hypothetical protein n=1 Tax=Candidatus Nitrosocosmicus hydrocola TaxID=1826872 RepID=UPI0013731FDB|nr:hypothetical protein [Candidatus Nitrosocosmicus hydrocola]